MLIFVPEDFAHLIRPPLLLTMCFLLTSNISCFLPGRVNKHVNRFDGSVSSRYWLYIQDSPISQHFFLIKSIRRKWSCLIRIIAISDSSFTSLTRKPVSLFYINDHHQFLYNISYLFPLEVFFYHTSLAFNSC